MDGTFKWMARGSAIAWFILGLVFVFNQRGFGFAFLILGLIYMERTTGLGEEWAKQNPMQALCVFAVLTVITFLLTMIAVIICIV